MDKGDELYRPVGTRLPLYGAPQRTDSLADLLERILDKGLMIAGDISVSIVDIELLKIRVRLMITSLDKAQELGVDWWRNDPFYSSHAPRVAPGPAVGTLPGTPLPVHANAPALDEIVAGMRALREEVETLRREQAAWRLESGTPAKASGQPAGTPRGRARPKNDPKR